MIYCVTPSIFGRDQTYLLGILFYCIPCIAASMCAWGQWFFHVLTSGKADKPSCRYLHHTANRDIPSTASCGGTVDGFLSHMIGMYSCLAGELLCAIVGRTLTIWSDLYRNFVDSRSGTSLSNT